MNSFPAFVQKEFRHIFRDARTMLILLAMPVIQILLFGFAISTEVRHVRFGVLAPKPDAGVCRMVEAVEAGDYFTLVRRFASRAEVLPAFQRDEVSLVLVYNEDNTALQILVDGSDPNQAEMMVRYVQSIIAAHAGQAGITAPPTLPRTQPLPQGEGVAPPPVTVKLLYNPQQHSAYNFVPGVMGLVLMLICAMMTSISIVREKEKGTMEVLLSSPLSSLTIIGAKLVPYFVLSMVNVASILLLAVYVLDVPIVGSLALLVGLSLLFVWVALSLGILVSTFTDSQAVAMLVSGMLLMVPVMLLSGMIFNIEAMPAPLQWISCIVPARWFIAAVRKVMLQGCGVAGIWRELTILATMAVALMTICFLHYKQRLA